MTVWLVGSYGNGNVGDDMLGHLALAAATSSAIDDVRVFAGELWPFGEAVSQRRGVVARSIRKGDRVLIAGGGLLNDQFGNLFLKYFAWVCFLARLRGAQVHIVGVGVEQLETRSARMLARVVFGLSRTIAVRDRHSLAVASTVTKRAIHGVDLGWSAALKFNSSVHNRGSYVVVTVAVETDDKRSSRFGTLRRTIIHLLEHSAFDIVLLPMQIGDEPALNDVGFLKELRESLASERVSLAPLGTYIDAYDLLQCANLVIGYRLHASVLGAIAGTPVIAISRSPKVSEALEGISGVIVVPELGADDDLDRVLEAIRQLPAIRDDVSPRINQLANEAFAGIRRAALG